MPSSWRCRRGYHRWTLVSWKADTTIDVIGYPSFGVGELIEKCDRCRLVLTTRSSAPEKPRAPKGGYESEVRDHG